MKAVIKFEWDEWLKAYPEFNNTLTEPVALGLYGQASMLMDASPGSEITDTPQRTMLLYLLMAHLALLRMNAVNRQDGGSSFFNEKGESQEQLSILHSLSRECGMKMDGISEGGAIFPDAGRENSPERVSSSGYRMAEGDNSYCIGGYVGREGQSVSVHRKNHEAQPCSQGFQNTVIAPLQDGASPGSLVERVAVGMAGGHSAYPSAYTGQGPVARGYEDQDRPCCGNTPPAYRELPYKNENGRNPYAIRGIAPGNMGQGCGQGWVSSPVSSSGSSTAFLDDAGATATLIPNFTGRVIAARQGSVSLTMASNAATGGIQGQNREWYWQTQYGALFWQLVAVTSHFEYVTPPSTLFRRLP